MMKMTEARLDYDAAIGFYQKSMNLLRMAARPPGKGGPTVILSRLFATMFARGALINQHSF